jgi:hypothetical protein
MSTDKLSGVEALAVPGKKEGEVKMINSGAIVEAYQVFNVDTVERG